MVVEMVHSRLQEGVQILSLGVAAERGQTQSLVAVGLTDRADSHSCRLALVALGSYNLQMVLVGRHSNFLMALAGHHSYQGAVEWEELLDHWDHQSLLEVQGWG